MPKSGNQGLSRFKHLSTEDRRNQGKSARQKVARRAHGDWELPPGRIDPITLLERSNVDRIPELIPIRYGRMLKSPFTFFRGSAAVMAADLSTTLSTGLRVQACGDCHLLNFGAYATPERKLIVDINDFDETLPAPWEWDIKRLGTSFVLACRSNGFSASVAREAAETVARSYREAMREFSEMRVLDVWYSKLDIESFIAGIADKDLRQNVSSTIDRQKLKSVVDYLVPKLTTKQDGRPVFKDLPPLLFHTREQLNKNFPKLAEQTFNTYKETLSDDRRVLIDRYSLQDVAIKVVGIGSVGTYCAVLLLLASENDPLILQIKQAYSSVLEAYAGNSRYGNHGQRVVVGQRLMQAHSDILLGWTEGAGRFHRHYYLRQLKDMKMSLLPETWTPSRAMEVALALGWVLARAHARSGDPAAISGYLGNGDVFDKSLAKFSVAYADQTETDYAVLCKAVKTGRIDAFVER